MTQFGSRPAITIAPPLAAAASPSEVMRCPPSGRSLVSDRAMCLDTALFNRACTMVGGIHMDIIIFSDIDPITAFWFGLIFFALLGLIPATIAYRRCLTDNYFAGEPHFTLADFVGWWVIGMAFFPIAMALSITNPFGTGSVAPRR
jgi:hypothetical protein